MATSQITMFVRNLSTSGAVNQMVKSPLQIFGLEGRYAQALYSAATKMKMLEPVEKDLLKFQSQIKTDGKLREFIKDPTYKREIKSNALKAVGNKMALQSATTNLLQCLAENGRLDRLDAVFNAFKMIMAAHRGEVSCEVTTAKELDPAQKKQLEGVLKNFLKKNESVLLTAKVDPSIIGGMIVAIGDKYVDMSIATKVKRFTKIISEVA